MKNGAKEIIGKRIKSVMIRERKSGQPRNQLLIGFDDNTCFEFYCYECEIGQTSGISTQDIYNIPGDGWKNVYVADANGSSLDRQRMKDEICKLIGTIVAVRNQLAVKGHYSDGI